MPYFPEQPKNPDTKIKMPDSSVISIQNRTAPKNRRKLLLLTVFLGLSAGTVGSIFFFSRYLSKLNLSSTTTPPFFPDSTEEKETNSTLFSTPVLVPVVENEVFLAPVELSSNDNVVNQAQRFFSSNKPPVLNHSEKKAFQNLGKAILKDFQHSNAANKPKEIGPIVYNSDTHVLEPFSCLTKKDTCAKESALLNQFDFDKERNNLIKKYGKKLVSRFEETRAGANEEMKARFSEIQYHLNFYIENQEIVVTLMKLWPDSYLLKKYGTSPIENCSEAASSAFIKLITALVNSSKLDNIYVTLFDLSESNLTYGVKNYPFSSHTAIAMFKLDDEDEREQFQAICSSENAAAYLRYLHEKDAYIIDPWNKMAHFIREDKNMSQFFCFEKTPFPKVADTLTIQPKAFKKLLEEASSTDGLDFLGDLKSDFDPILEAFGITKSGLEYR